MDLSPLWISIKTGIWATAISFFVGIYAALLVLRCTPRKKAILDSLFTLPMVLPPTVAGFVLLLIFSRRRPVGAFLYNTFGISVVQTFAGCVIAATVVAFPLMYKSARAAFEQLDKGMVDAGRALGLPDSKVFWLIVIPNARPGLIAGAILTFARAMGEYGATSMLAGNIPGRTGTISQKIAMVMQDGDYASAGLWSVIILVIALIIIVVTNLVYSGKTEYKGSII